jgi:hypothetical protein
LADERRGPCQRGPDSIVNASRITDLGKIKILPAPEIVPIGRTQQSITKRGSGRWEDADIALRIWGVERLRFVELCNLNGQKIKGAR